MVKVLKGINENKIIIGFVIIMLFITVYTGLKQRNMESISNNQVVLYNK